LFEQPSLVVPKSCGETALTITRELGLLGRGFRITLANGEIIIPLRRKPSREELSVLQAKLQGFKISSHSFRTKRKRPRDLSEALTGLVPSSLLSHIPRSFDIIGNIALLEIPRDLSDYSDAVAEALIQVNPHVKTVLAKASPITNTFRTRDFKILAGEDLTLTEHIEHGCVFRVDPRKAYFSPRLSYERQRVSLSVRSGEIIVDMFAGVGPFSIMAAKLGKAKKVYGIDINPEAVSFMLQNIMMNDLRGKVSAILADSASTPAQLLEHVADHIIMNLPKESLPYITQACDFLRPEGGLIHFYTITSEKASAEAIVSLLKARVENSGRTVKAIKFMRDVKTVAPREKQLAIDLEVH
jgi:tRNA (guanine37-N1)-methyltransferase